MDLEQKITRINEEFDPYADFKAEVIEPAEDLSIYENWGKDPYENYQDKDTLSEQGYTVADIIRVVSSRPGEYAQKATVGVSLNILDDDTERASLLSNITFDSADIQIQRRKKAVCFELDFPSDDHEDFKAFWEILEAYAKQRESIKENDPTTPMLDLFIVPNDYPDLFIGGKNPMFWTKQPTEPGGPVSTISILFNADFVTHSSSDKEQDIIIRDIVNKSDG